MSRDTPDPASARRSDFRPLTVEQHRRVSEESLLYAKAAREGRAVKYAMVLWPTAEVEAVVPSGGPVQHLAEPEPHADPVDGNALLDEFAATLERYLVISRAAATTLALWALHTWAAPALAFSPRLAITSPEPQAGKTTALRALSLLVPRPLFPVYSRNAELTRIVDAVRPTLLLDDADTSALRNRRLRAMLAAGAAREGKLMVPSRSPWELPAVNCFSPCALALSGPVPDDLAKHCITLTMTPLGKDERREPLDTIQPHGASGELRAKAVRWVRDNAGPLAEMQISDPPISFRARQLWRPLLVLADHAGGDWCMRGRTAALELSVATGARSESVELLDDIRMVFTYAAADRLSSDTLIKRLRSDPERRWREQKLSPRRLADYLSRYAIKPRTLRLEDGTFQRGYHAADFADAFSRYLGKPKKEEEVF